MAQVWGVSCEQTGNFRLHSLYVVTNIGEIILIVIVTETQLFQKLISQTCNNFNYIDRHLQIYTISNIYKVTNIGSPNIGVFISNIWGFQYLSVI